MTRTFKRIISLALVLLMLFALAACSSAPGKDNEAGNNNAPDAPNYYPLYNKPTADEVSPDAGMPPEGENSPAVKENPFIATAENNVSTFSADVDTASYTYFRKLVNNGYSLQALKSMGANFRTEEFINYFRYNVTGPKENELFGVNVNILPTPWNETTRLLSMTLQAEEAPPTEGNNLVFLIDVSGSMASRDKLPLLKTAFAYLVDQLTENDRVSIVTYSGREQVVLEACPGNQAETILAAINGLNASGSTNGEAGLTMAYQLAESCRIEGGNNRIIMASDGDLNVGISSESQLKEYIAQKRDTGIYLSVLGFGTGNYQDTKMEALADNGNGVYYYIDGASEAEKVFATDLLGTLYTVANDVKMQLTFDPVMVASYRLIGYENRLLNQEDFEDDTKDAGEVGAGHQVTVCYELVLTENAMTSDADWFRLAIRYKRIGESESTLNEYGVNKSFVMNEMSDDHKFMTAVMQTVMILHNSKYAQDITMESILAELNALNLENHPERAEFRTLIQKLCTPLSTTPDM